MKYCDNCAEQEGFPITEDKTTHSCVVCGKVKVCNDMQLTAKQLRGLFPPIVTKQEEVEVKLKIIKDGILKQIKTATHTVDIRLRLKNTDPYELSAREIELLQLKWADLTNSQIASMSGRGKRTIDSQVDNLRRKIGVKSIVLCFHEGLRLGMLGYEGKPLKDAYRTKVGSSLFSYINEPMKAIEMRVREKAAPGIGIITFKDNIKKEAPFPWGEMKVGDFFILNEKITQNRKSSIKRHGTKWCAVNEPKNWVTTTEIEGGAIFKKIKKKDTPHFNQHSKRALTTNKPHKKSDNE